MSASGRITCVLGTAAAALLLMAPAAHADHWGSADPTGDVVGSTWSPEPEPCGTETPVDATTEAHTDITRLTVRHSRRAVEITTHYRDLDPSLEKYLALYVRSADRGWWVDLDRYRSRNGRWHTMTFMAREPRLPDPDDVEGCGIGIVLFDVGCRIVSSVDFDADVVSLTIPRRCLRDPRWVRVAAASYRWVDSDDPDNPSSTSFSDLWDGGTELTPWAPPYGPRVHATKGASYGGGRFASRATGERRTVVVRSDGEIARR
ncbi:hypothetical protein [Nocardioides sp. MH1]|uniref:hypothetical protein n=1 Tax=Nocardioides sp. MH1 TaxID=3242490 RepID=UPI003522AD74